MENENPSEILQIEEGIHEAAQDEGKDDGKDFEALEAQLAESRQEIQRLSALIDARERTDREAAAFAELFPSLTPDEIPDSVRAQSEKEGIPLIAAYALYARRQEVAAGRAGAAAERSAKSSAGPISGSSGESDFFTLDQIRAMTPKEVKKHYKTILKSLNKG